MLWCQGMWYSSKESQSTKLRQSTSKNQGSCKIRSQSCQDRQQKPKSHNNSYLRLRHQNIQIRRSQSQRQSTQGSYCKNRRRLNLKNQQPAERSAAEGRYKGHRQGRTKGPSPPKNSQTKTSIKHHKFAWQRLRGTSIPTTRTNRKQSKKPSTIPHAGSSGRKPFKTKSTLISRTTPGISSHVLEIAKLSQTNSPSSTRRTKSHESSGTA